jgi:hypothetical protein
MSPQTLVEETIVRPSNGSIVSDSTGEQADKVSVKAVMIPRVFIFIRTY